MFKGATWAVTLKENTNLEDYELLKSVIEEHGAHTILTTPKEHDRAVALISHAPMLMLRLYAKILKTRS